MATPQSAMQAARDERDALASGMKVEDVRRAKAYFRSVGNRLIAMGVNTDAAHRAMRAQKLLLLECFTNDVHHAACASTIRARELLGRRS
jgi:hypothetical protein